jgi:hypothetical protein
MSVVVGTISFMSLECHVTAMWGKSPDAAGRIYPLLCHLLDTAVVARLIWDTRVREGLKRRLCALAACDDATAKQAFMLAAELHDVGKVNPWFQYQEALTHWLGVGLTDMVRSR